jgi:hypothetical protein
MSRVKATYRSRAIFCRGKQVYAPRYRAEWFAKIACRHQVDVWKRGASFDAQHRPPHGLIGARRKSPADGSPVRRPREPASQPPQRRLLKTLGSISPDRPKVFKIVQIRECAVLHSSTVRRRFEPSIVSVEKSAKSIL